MRVIRHVAVNVFRESVRDRVPYTLLLFAVLLIAASRVLAQLTAGQDVKIVKDLGLAAIAAFGLFIAVFLGVGLVSKEVERRSIYAILAKPVSRAQFIAGKYAGLVLTLFVNVMVMTGALYLVLAWLMATATPAERASWDAPAMDPEMLGAVLMIFIELMLVTAIALFFSAFTSPLLSAACTFGLYVIGHFTGELRDFDTLTDSRAVGWLTRGLYHLLPDFSAFDVKLQVVHGIQLPAGYLATTAAYGFAYVAALILGGTYIFTRRDLK